MVANLIKVISLIDSIIKSLSFIVDFFGEKNYDCI